MLRITQKLASTEIKCSSIPNCRSWVLSAPWSYWIWYFFSKSTPVRTKFFPRLKKKILISSVIQLSSNNKLDFLFNYWIRSDLFNHLPSGSIWQALWLANSTFLTEKNPHAWSDRLGKRIKMITSFEHHHYWIRGKLVRQKWNSDKEKSKTQFLANK